MCFRIPCENSPLGITIPSNRIKSVLRRENNLIWHGEEITYSLNLDLLRILEDSDIIPPIVEMEICGHWRWIAYRDLIESIPNNSADSWIELTKKLALFHSIPLLPQRGDLMWKDSIDYALTTPLPIGDFGYCHSTLSTRTAGRNGLGELYLLEAWQPLVGSKGLDLAILAGNAVVEMNDWFMWEEILLAYTASGGTGYLDSLSQSEALKIVATHAIENGDSLYAKKCGGMYNLLDK